MIQDSEVSQLAMEAQQDRGYQDLLEVITSRGNIKTFHLHILDTHMNKFIRLYLLLLLHQES